MNGHSDLQQTSKSSDFKIPAVNAPQYYQTRLRFKINSKDCLEALGQILKRLVRMDLPGKDQVAAYLRHLMLGNRRPRTLYSRFGAIILFLGLIRESGRISLEAITRRDVEAFIEREQDRGIKITTIRTRLVSVQAFLRYLLEEGIVSAELFSRRIRLQLPERLPRAMDPDDLRKLLSVIEDIRDRAMILVLLRTGLRIGELLNTQMADVHLKERKIEIDEGEKNRLGRVVYLSDDALSALEAYMQKRKWAKEKRVFLVQKGPQRGKPISVRGIQKRIEHYSQRAEIRVSCHHLRHTMATQLLNADADLVTIQDLLGHSLITTTQCYCRVSNLKVQRDYYKAIKVVMQRTQPRREVDFELNDKSARGEQSVTN